LHLAVAYELMVPGCRYGGVIAGIQGVIDCGVAMIVVAGVWQKGIDAGGWCHF